jgi:hypothetical protein
VTEAGNYPIPRWLAQRSFLLRRGGPQRTNLQFTGDDFFADKDVCSIVIELLNSAFGPKKIRLWAPHTGLNGRRGGGWVQAGPQCLLWILACASDEVEDYGAFPVCQLERSCIREYARSPTRHESVSMREATSNRALYTRSRYAHDTHGRIDMCRWPRCFSSS